MYHFVDGAPPSQSHTFGQYTFKKAFGCSERAVPKALSKALTKLLLLRYGVGETAVHQQLHHSRKVHEENNARGQWNSLNSLQAELFGWSQSALHLHILNGLTIGEWLYIVFTVFTRLRQLHFLNRSSQVVPVKNSQDRSFCNGARCPTCTIPSTGAVDMLWLFVAHEDETYVLNHRAGFHYPSVFVHIINEQIMSKSST